MSELLKELDLPMYDNVLPNPDEISYYVLEKDRKLYIDDDIGEELTCIHRMILRWNMEDKGIEPEKRKPIWIYIMSYGGDIDTMMMLLNTIEASRTPIYTVNIGVAHSAAGLIFMSGKKRFMGKYATIMIHEGSARFGGDAVKVQDQADSYKKIIKWMKEYVLSHSKIPRTTLMKRRANDWEIDSDYCLANGVCDVVFESLDEII